MKITIFHILLQTIDDHVFEKYELPKVRAFISPFCNPTLFKIYSLSNGVDCRQGTVHEVQKVTRLC